MQVVFLQPLIIIVAKSTAIHPRWLVLGERRGLISRMTTKCLFIGGIYRNFSSVKKEKKIKKVSMWVDRWLSTSLAEL